MKLTSFQSISLFLIVIYIILPLRIFADEIVSDFRVNSTEIGQYEKFEISFQVKDVYRNPFDPCDIDIQAHFETPSGKLEPWPAFYFQDYDKETFTGEVVRGGVTKVVSRDFYNARGKPYWKIRYSPVEIGVYHYYITVKVGRTGNVYRYPDNGGRLTFTAVASDKRGFIGVSSKDPRYFSFNDGSTFFPVGYGPEIDETKIGRFIDYNMNIVQSEYNYNFSIEHRKVGEYDLEKAFKADEILNLLEDNDIYLQIVFESWPNWSDQATSENDNVHWDTNPYNIVNGGPLEYPLQFDYDEKAKQHFRNKVRYCIARWGYSPNVFCWQLWGEYDIRLLMASPENKSCYSVRSLVEWHREMSSFIKGWDSRHMVTTTEAMAQSYSDYLWELNTIDYITMHYYNLFVDWRISRQIDRYRSMETGKPILIQEFGPEALRGSSDLNLEAYRAAYHNPLWIAVMMKCAGVPMKWTWYGDPREEAMNIYEDYRMMYRFFQDADLANGNLSTLELMDLTIRKKFEPLVHRGRNKTVRIREGGMLSPVEIRGIGNNNRAYIWIRDIRYNVYELHKENYAPQNMKDVIFQLNNLDEGLYKIEFWDTRSGEIKQSEQSESRQGKLRVKVPDFKRDIAVKIYSIID